METDDIPEGLMQAILLPLIRELLPIVGNDQDAAWKSAEAATMCSNPQTVIEFRLAVRVALFNIQANRLTAEANASSLTPACAIRMRNCALSYARAADKAEHRLEKLQAARTKEEKPKSEPAAAPAEATPSEAPSKAQAANIPAYKQLKQERRLAKQQERDARLKAQADADRTRDPAVPLAA